MFKKIFSIVKNKKILIPALFLLLSVIGINVHIVYVSKDYIDIDPDVKDGTVIVLGARVYGSGRISDVYTDRLLTGAEIVKNTGSAKIMVSGDNRESHNLETLHGKVFLEKQGIPAGIISEDESGFTTFDSVRNILKERNKKIIFVSQKYHLYRAVYIARAFGIQAYGVSSDRRRYRGIVWFQLREVFARVKAFMMIRFLHDDV